MELPSHPDTEDSPAAGGGRPRLTSGTVVALVLGAVVLVVIVLHLTGVVGPASH